jgi:hypothetical protein
MKKDNPERIYLGETMRKGKQMERGTDERRER